MAWSNLHSINNELEKDYIHDFFPIGDVFNINFNLDLNSGYEEKKVETMHNSS